MLALMMMLMMMTIRRRLVLVTLSAEHVYVAQWLDVMVGAHAALLALARLGVVAEGESERMRGRVIASTIAEWRRCKWRRHHRVAAALATLATPLAARERGAHVVLVERADLESERARLLPTRVAHATVDLVAGLGQHALEAHGLYETRLARNDRLERRVDAVVHGRREQGAIDERKLVVHGQLCVTEHARQTLDAERAETRQHLAANLVVAVRSFVLEPHVSGVLLGDGQAVDERPVVAARRETLGRRGRCQLTVRLEFGYETQLRRDHERLVKSWWRVAVAALMRLLLLLRLLARWLEWRRCGRRDALLSRSKMMSALEWPHLDRNDRKRRGRLHAHQLLLLLLRMRDEMRIGRVSEVAIKRIVLSLVLVLLLLLMCADRRLLMVECRIE